MPGARTWQEVKCGARYFEIKFSHMMQSESIVLHRRRIATKIEKMDRRRGSFSPQYKPLLEEGESETSDPSGRGNSHTTRSPQGTDYEERVVILSDRNEGEGNGDADSGISLTEMAGEEHLGPNRLKHPSMYDKPESLLILVVQIVIPFFFAGFGMMAAGLLLDAVQVSYS